MFYHKKFSSQISFQHNNLYITKIISTLNVFNYEEGYDEEDDPCVTSAQAMMVLNVSRCSFMECSGTPPTWYMVDDFKSGSFN